MVLHVYLLLMVFHQQVITSHHCQLAIVPHLQVLGQHLQPITLLTAHSHTG